MYAHFEQNEGYQNAAQYFRRKIFEKNMKHTKLAHEVLIAENTMYT